MLKNPLYATLFICVSFEPAQNIELEFLMHMRKYIFLYTSCVLLVYFIYLLITVVLTHMSSTFVGHLALFCLLLTSWRWLTSFPYMPQLVRAPPFRARPVKSVSDVSVSWLRESEQERAAVVFATMALCLVTAGWINEIYLIGSAMTTVSDWAACVKEINIFCTELIKHWNVKCKHSNSAWTNSVMVAKYSIFEQ